MKEPTITLTLSEYNNLVENQLRCQYPKVVRQKKLSKIKQFFLLSHFFRNKKYERMVKICINETYNVLYDDIMGYWGSCINEDMKENFYKDEMKYKRRAFDKILDKLDTHVRLNSK